MYDQNQKVAVIQVKGCPPPSNTKEEDDDTKEEEEEEEAAITALKWKLKSISGS